MILERGDEPGASALFSDDRRYRYQLERRVPGVEGAARLVCCGLNPSTADAFRLDPTCRREIALARRLGCAIYVKVNAYAWRDTQPAGMRSASRAGENIIGEPMRGEFDSNANDIAIRTALTMMLSDGGVALACWGVHVACILTRSFRLRAVAAEVGVQWQCIGRNKGGSPKHPLYVRGDAPLVPWP